MFKKSLKIQKRPGDDYISGHNGMEILSPGGRVLASVWENWHPTNACLVETPEGPWEAELHYTVDGGNGPEEKIYGAELADLLE